MERIIPKNEHAAEMSLSLAKRLSAFEDAYRAAADTEQTQHSWQIPDLRFTTDAGVNEAAELRQQPGEIIDASGVGDRNPIIVTTDAGVICESDREIATDKIVGCACVLVIGPQKKMMLHLTPHSGLPYLENVRSGATYADSTAKRILQSMQESGMQPEECRVITLANLGQANEDEKNFHKRQNASLDALCNTLRAGGVASALSVELPMDRTAVYHSPERPDDIAVIGFSAHYDAQGSVQDDVNEIHGYWLPIDKKTEFAIERPLSAEEKIQKVRAYMQQMQAEGVPRSEMIQKAQAYRNQLDSAHIQ